MDSDRAKDRILGSNRKATAIIRAPDIAAGIDADEDISVERDEPASIGMISRTADRIPCRAVIRGTINAVSNGSKKSCFLRHSHSSLKIRPRTADLRSPGRAAIGRYKNFR